MAVLAGNAGSARIGADTILEIDKWTLNVGPNLAPSHSFGDTWEESSLTTRKWSGSFSGRLDPADTTGHVALRSAALNGTSVALRLYTAAATYYSGTAFIEKSVDADESGLVGVSYTFTGSGALSYT